MNVALCALDAEGKPTVARTSPSMVESHRRLAVILRHLFSVETCTAQDPCRLLQAVIWPDKSLYEKKAYSKVS